MKSSMNPWGALLAVSLVYACGNGVMANCLGVVFAAIIKDMGFMASQMSLFHSVRSVTMSLAVGAMGSMFLNCRNPKLYMVATGLASSAAFAAMSFYHEIWQWYASAVVAGICMSTLGFVVPIVINNWFKVKQGTLTGIAFMGSGIMGALLSPVFSNIIAAAGWRATCLVMGACGIILWVLPCLFLFRRDPKDTGDQPYGAALQDTYANAGGATAADSGANAGGAATAGSDVSAGSAAFAGQNADSGYPDATRTGTDMKAAGSGRKAAVPAAIFILMVIAISPVSSLVSMINQLATFATTLGYDLSVGAMITSCAMVGNLGGKLASGVISDRFGAIRMLTIFTFIVGIGMLLILVGATSSPLLLYVGALFLGGSFSVGMTGPSLAFREIYGDDYAGKLKTYTFLSGLFGTVTGFAFPLVYDMCGSWTPVFIYGIVVCAAAVGVFMYVGKQVKAAGTSR